MRHPTTSRLIVAVVMCSALLVATIGTRGEEPAPANQVIRSFEETFGVHPGQPARHAGSICVAGEFIGTSAASMLSRSRLFGGNPVPVVARFSVIGGNPSSRSAREMELEFRLPDGSQQHMAMLNTPIFVAANPIMFTEMISALKPDPNTGEPDEGRLLDFLTSHPEAFAASNFVAVADPPASYANSPYFSVHTFRFIDALGRTHFVRWRFIPDDGEKTMTPSQIVWTAGAIADERFIERLARGPVKWDMMVYVGEPGDTLDNAVIAWPEARKHFKAGTLILRKSAPAGAVDCAELDFDPLVVADGIAPAGDPLLLFRSPTYALAFTGRLSKALAPAHSRSVVGR